MKPIPQLLLCLLLIACCIIAALASESAKLTFADTPPTDIVLTAPSGTSVVGLGGGDSPARWHNYTITFGGGDSGFELGIDVKKGELITKGEWSGADGLRFLRYMVRLNPDLIRLAELMKDKRDLERERSDWEWKEAQSLSITPAVWYGGTAPRSETEQEMKQRHARELKRLLFADRARTLDSAIETLMRSIYPEPLPAVSGFINLPIKYP